MAKAPDLTDKHVGRRVRARRLMLGMSQEKLGKALGLSFQQVQKYEKGANRISASRLHQLAHILQVPPASFFEGAPHVKLNRNVADAPPADFLSNFPTAVEDVALVKAFLRIKNRKTRRSIVALVQGIADDER